VAVGLGQHHHQVQRHLLFLLLPPPSYPPHHHHWELQSWQVSMVTFIILFLPIIFITMEEYRQYRHLVV
jgi:hypothetical protein